MITPELIFKDDFRTAHPQQYQEFLAQWLTARDQWLDSVTARSGSVSTRRTYITAIDTLWLYLKAVPEMIISDGRRAEYEAEMMAKGLAPTKYRAPWTISPRDASSYRVWLDKGHKPATVAHYIAVASSFFQDIIGRTELDASGVENSLFFDARGVVRSNPFRNSAVSRPKVDAYNKSKSVDKDLVNEFFDAIRQDNDPLTKARDLALFRAYLLTGRRATEIVTLRWGDIRRIDDENYEFRFVGKGHGRSRGEDANWDRLPLPADVYHGIVDYLKVDGRWPGIKRDEYIFRPITDEGIANFHNVDASRLEANRHIASRRVGQLMDKITTRAGMERIHPHQLRHTFAINVYMATNDIRLVQRLLGHSHINTTQIYLGKLEIKKDTYSKSMIAHMGFRV